MAAIVRRRTGVQNAWLAKRLAMGHECNVSRALAKVKGERRLETRVGKLERVLGRRG